MSKTEMKYAKFIFFKSSYLKTATTRMVNSYISHFLVEKTSVHLGPSLNVLYFLVQERMVVRVQFSKFDISL